MSNATSVPNVLTNPGFLFGAPLGTALPVNTVVGSKFTDAWPVAWMSFGATESGSTLSYDTTVTPVDVAEFFDPIKYFTTARSGSFAFNLADYTLANYARALNGGAPTVVSGTGATQLSNISPPPVGQETRLMIGWESLDSTIRVVAYQTINGGKIDSVFDKAPKLAVIPCTFNMEIPASGKPFDMWAAGDARTGV